MLIDAVCMPTLHMLVMLAQTMHAIRSSRHRLNTSKLKELEVVATSNI